MHMSITRPALAAFILGITPISLCEIVAQESADPRSNAIDPAALISAPAFGDSGPAIRSPGPAIKENQPPGPEWSSEKTEDWQPRFRIHLHQQLPNSATPENEAPDISSLTVPQIGSPVIPFDPASIEDEVELLSDNVSLDARKDLSGELLYSLSCKGRITLNMDGLKISGRDCSLAEGKMTIRNAEVITQRNLTLHADRITLVLALTGITVHNADAKIPSVDEKLMPIPDPIGEIEKDGAVPEQTTAERSAAPTSAAPTSDMASPPSEK
jgi:hypothetical protein